MHTKDGSILMLSTPTDSLWKIDSGNYHYEIRFIFLISNYKNLIYTDLATEGIFYVPGSVTTDMSNLYLVDSYAANNNIQGIKLLVEDGYIQVAYQESPQDICELQNPTNSSLQPLVCLPNELVINIYTNLSGNQFIPDSVLEWFYVFKYSRSYDIHYLKNYTFICCNLFYISSFESSRLTENL